MSATAEPPGDTLAPEAAPPSGRTDLGRVAARGAGVTLAGQGARILLQLASVTVLARLLSPGDYGLLAVGLVVVGVGEVFRDLGLTTAAIRAPDLTRGQRDGLFWLNVAAGALLAVLALAAAAPVAALFRQPELADVVRSLSAVFLLNGLTAQYRAGLVRDLRFGAVAGVDLGASWSPSPSRWGPQRSVPGTGRWSPSSSPRAWWSSSSSSHSGAGCPDGRGGAWAWDLWCASAAA